MSIPPAPSINLTDTLGALLIGTYISTALFGITCLQTFNYYNDYPSDSIFIKSLVSTSLLYVKAKLHYIPSGRYRLVLYMS